ncbi:MAG: antibiotic biosynthesis monooxygenase [Pseudomonadota bacterium]
MITIIAKWTILKGCREPALAALSVLAREVEQQEPFVLMYTIHTPDMGVPSFPTPQPDEVDFFSVFTDYAAFQQHLNGPVFQAWADKYKQYFLTNASGLFVISEFLQREAGFVRAQMLTPAASQSAGDSPCN